ncbi:MAG: ExbD/TolR family protein [Burkholderiales bacterium]
MAMQMNTGGADGHEPEVMLEMNTTPLIDVMLVLIIMLIITIPVQLHAVNLDLPSQSTTVPSQPPEVVLVVVRPDGQVLWNGEVLSQQALLETRLAALAAQNPMAELHLRPDAAAPYGAVARVLAAAQRLNLSKLGLVGQEQFAR